MTLTTTDWLDSNAGGSGSPGVYFGEIGAKVTGSIIGTPRTVETEFGERLVVELRAADGCTAQKGTRGEDGEIGNGDEVSLWIKPGAMATALRAALKEAGAKGLSDGDTVTVLYHADGEQKKAGYNKPKLFKAKYATAAPSVSLDDF